MRLVRTLLLGVVVIVSTSWAHADTIAGDPDIEILGGGGSTPVGTTFRFVSPSGTSPGTSPCILGETTVPDCDFQNASGINWVDLRFDITPTGQSGPFNCRRSVFFNSCTFNEGGTQVIFFNSPTDDDIRGLAEGKEGIPAGADFRIVVRGWAPGSGFAGAANTIPEPGTIGLFLIGMGAIVARRRKAKRSASPVSSQSCE